MKVCALLLVTESGMSVRVHTDSLVSVQVLKKGFSKSPLLDQLASIIWRIVLSRSLDLHLSYIRGNYNVRADQLSRGTVISTEWTLNPQNYKHLLQKLAFVPQVDLFATDLNKKCSLYMSPCPDQQAVAIDSFNNKWDYLYLFPPTSVISKALAKLRTSKFKKALLVCPELVGKAWYQNLLLFNRESLRLSLHLQQMVKDQLIIQEQPPKLVVFNLSGNTITSLSKKSI